MVTEVQEFGEGRTDKQAFDLDLISRYEDTQVHTNTIEKFADPVLPGIFYKQLCDCGVSKGKIQENSLYGQYIIVKNDYDNDSIISIIGNCVVYSLGSVQRQL